jgi:PAS domain S-box-containing protein
MSTFRELPAAAQRLIASFAVLAFVAVLILIPEMRTWGPEELGAVLGLSLAAALSEQFTVAVAHRTETENFSVTDALWVPALILAPPGVLTVSVLLGTLAGHAFRRWDWYKVIFNASQFTLAITAAEVVYHRFDLSPSEFTLMTWVGCAIAMSCYFAVNELSVALIISRVEGMSLREVVLLPGGLNLLHAGGNLTIGMLAALVWQAGPVGMPLLIAPIVLSFFAYRGWLQNQRDEEQRRERDRMRTLYEAGRALFGPLDTNFDFQPFLQLVRRLVDAAGAELVLRDDAELRVYNSESGLSLTTANGPDVEPRDFVSARPGLSTYLAPVGDAETEVGILAVHRAAELSPSECTLVDALASQVSARQQNEQLFNETVEQRGHLADVVGSSSDGIFVLSGDRTVLSWNPAMERITGFRGEEVIGRRFGEALRLRGEPDGEGTEAQGLVLGTVRPQEALIMRRDGSERWIRYSTSGMPDRHGGGASHVVTARDVTAELEADQMKSDFVATVSHELRTPLTPLRGLLQSLDAGLVEDTPEARREYFAIMLRQTERLERLINDLLDVSRIDAGRLRMDAVPVEIGAALEREVHDACQLPDAREVRYERPKEPVWAMVDQFRLGQIVSNLLSNAFKYSPAGTDVAVQLAKAGDHVVVSVRDSGEGIALADQERIFERFYRSHNGNTRTVGGFGLGLYIAKRLAEAMGGTLVLDSPPGQGCTFSLNLPLLMVNPGQTQARRPRTADPATIGTPGLGD